MSSEDAEELLHDSVIELFDLSDYSSTLPNDAKERYVAKLFLSSVLIINGI